MLSITWVLALFTLLTISTGVYFASKRSGVPYTVLLVAVGIALALIVEIPLLEPVFGFIDDITLTPALLFYIFLPVLIFESAYNMNVRKIVESAWSITLLSIASLIISAFLIGGVLFYILPLIGFQIPFVIALLFGSIISATDPVAVLSLFKEFGAPKRLTLIFEGESLFNDGTAVALFFVVLAIAINGFHGAHTLIEGGVMFTVMVLGGILFGICMAMVFSRALRYTRSNEFVSVLLLIISAHITFILCELINEQDFLFLGIDFKLSSIIATTITALFLGNYSRHILSPQSDSYIEKFVGHIAFIVNSLVFILIGILFTRTQISLVDLWLPIMITIFVVAASRAVSVYTVIIPFNALKLETHIPRTWQHLLSWGSLRGALAIIVALIIPVNLPESLNIIVGSQVYSPQQFILALVIGCILATLFVKALTIGPLMRRMKVNDPTALEEAHHTDLAIYYLLTENARFEEQKARGFIQAEYFDVLKKRVQVVIEKAKNHREELRNEYTDTLFEQSLHITAIDIEEKYLKELYINDEVCEKVYRKIKGKLVLQREKIEIAQHNEINESAHTDRKDVFDGMMNALQTVFDKKARTFTVQNSFEYYRAQSIISRKVVKTIKGMQDQYGTPVFVVSIFDSVLAMYEGHREKANNKMDTLAIKYKKEINDHMMYLSHKALNASGNKAISYLEDKGLINEVSAEHIKHVYALE